ncbi:unnamed protein product [Lymnaea stagnalis]|uniref:Uncharacterized protein n=1 Tax=Lymnaea stagnalis TaxID=6523 RepID=A0AAV2HPG5_LYMST
MSKSEEKIMHTTGSANVETSIDALMEEELQQMDFNDHLDDNFDEDGDDDQDLIAPLNGPNELDNNNELNNDELPPEVRHYVKTLESQSAQLEKELLLCDEFLKDSLNQEKAPSNAVMPYDDAKLLADAAAEAGMTVEEFKHKILKDLETDDFSEEMMDREYEEFTQMQKELADMTADIYETMHRNDENELLAIEASCDENINNANDDTGEISSSLALRYLREHRLAISDTENKAGPLVSMAALSSMRDFIHQQLRKTEEGFHTRQQNLVESIERHKQEEEKWTLVEEERKNKLHLEREGEEAALREREKCQQGRLEGELKVLDDQLAQELSYHQAEIKKLSEDLEAEKTRYEAEHSHWLMSLEATRSHAALAIQRRYRGYRTRRAMSATMKDLEEMKTLRKNERYKLRVLEVEYQMKYTTEQDRK